MVVAVWTWIKIYQDFILGEMEKMEKLRYHCWKYFSSTEIVSTNRDNLRRWKWVVNFTKLHAFTLPFPELPFLWRQIHLSCDGAGVFWLLSENIFSSLCQRAQIDSGYSHCSSKRNLTYHEQSLWARNPPLCRYKGAMKLYNRKI